METTIVRGLYGVPIEMSVAEYVVCICDRFATMCAEVVTTLRSEYGPFIRGVIQRPIRELQGALLADPEVIARCKEGNLPPTNWVIQRIVKKGEVPKTNACGEDLLAELVFTVGSIAVTVELVSAHPAIRLFGSITHVANTVTLKAERRALKLLRQHVTRAQYQMYQLTGALIHESVRLPYFYVIRRGFPTLVFEFSDIDGVRHSTFKLGLCAHVGSYPPGHFSGNYCPTDDVIAHLLLLRADEDGFWSESNVHLPLSGLLGL